MSIDLNQLRSELRTVQEAVCPNRAEFARRMGVHRNTVDRVLTGDGTMTVDTLLAWLDVAKVRPSVFFAAVEGVPAVTAPVTPPPQTGSHVGPLAPSTTTEAQILLRLGAMLTAAAQMVIAGAPLTDSPAPPPAPGQRDGQHD